MKQIGLIIVSLIIVVLIAGCDGKITPRTQGGKLYVVATTGMIADAVRNIGGEYVKVDGLMGPGVDPHTKKSTPDDTHKLATAQIVFFNGLHLEGKMSEILKQFKRQKPVYAVSEDIPQDRLRRAGEFIGSYDPHIWFDVSLWHQACVKIEKELCRHDAGHAEYYKRQGAAYRRRLDELHAWVRQRIATIPKANRVLITAHDAFGYFGRAYDIEVVGLQGISTASGYGIKDEERIIELLVKRRVKAVFVESSVPTKAIESVVEKCRAQGHHVSIGGTLYSDAMGQAGTSEGNYLGMVRYNVTTMVAALHGQVSSGK